MSQFLILAPFSHYYACEPDGDEAKRLPAKLKADGPWRAITVFPEALSSNEGQATLYITKQPGLSSLLQPNYAVVNTYYHGDEFRIDSTASVSTISLERAAERHGFSDACFLKLDTQGTELDILQSGRKLLEESILAIYVELEFHPFYQEQPLFSDVDSYLRGLNFSLFDLHRALHRRASYRNDFYSRRQVVWAHALYMKHPDVILEADEGTAALRAARLLGLALAFEHYDLALELSTCGRSAALLSQTYGDQVRQDVEEFVRRRTKVILKMIKSRRSRPKPMAFAFKDRDNLYP